MIPDKIDSSNFSEIDNSSIEQAPFAIRFIFNYFPYINGGSIRFTKVQYSDFSFFVEYKEWELFWEQNKLKGFFTKDMKPVNSENIEPYFKEFARGFYFGYANYENKIKKNTSVFNDIASNADQIFKTINLNNGYLCAFEVTEIKKKLIGTVSKEIYYNKGLLMGENYRAWQIIIENPQHFIDKFLNSKIFIRIYKSSIDFFSSDKMYLGILEGLKSLIKNLPPPQVETETEQKHLKELSEFGFFKLPKVKQLSELQQKSLVELICRNKMPYGIAMFDYLGFCEYLDKEQGAKYKANIILSKLYNPKAKEGTSARHLRSSLIKPKQRYNAKEYKETVKKDYEELK